MAKSDTLAYNPEMLEKRPRDNQPKHEFSQQTFEFTLEVSTDSPVHSGTVHQVVATTAASAVQKLSLTLGASLLLSRVYVDPSQARARATVQGLSVDRIDGSSRVW